MGNTCAGEQAAKSVEVVPANESPQTEPEPKLPGKLVLAKYPKQPDGEKPLPAYLPEDCKVEAWDDTQTFKVTWADEPFGLSDATMWCQIDVVDIENMRRATQKAVGALQNFVDKQAEGAAVAQLSCSTPQGVDKNHDGVLSLDEAWELCKRLTTSMLPYAEVGKLVLKRDTFKSQVFDNFSVNEQANAKDVAGMFKKLANIGINGAKTKDIGLESLLVDKNAEQLEALGRLVMAYWPGMKEGEKPEAAYLPEDCLVEADTESKFKVVWASGISGGLDDAVKWKPMSADDIASLAKTYDDAIKWCDDFVNKQAEGFAQHIITEAKAEPDDVLSAEDANNLANEMVNKLPKIRLYAPNVFKICKDPDQFKERVFNNIAGTDGKPVMKVGDAPTMIKRLAKLAQISLKAQKKNLQIEKDALDA